jgi:hypothetical protein
MKEKDRDRESWIEGKNILFLPLHREVLTREEGMVWFRIQTMAPAQPL